MFYSLKPNQEDHQLLIIESCVVIGSVILKLSSNKHRQVNSSENFHMRAILLLLLLLLLVLLLLFIIIIIIIVILIIFIFCASIARI